MATAGTPEVSAGDHACCQFATDDAQAQLVGSFARDAVVRGDRIFYLADRSDETDVVDFLANAGLDGRSMLDSGALQVMHSSELDMDDGFDGARQLSAWRKLTAAARDDGYRGLAATAEMSWALSGKVDRDELIAYEASAEPVFMTGELSAICQYDMRVFDRDLLRQAGHAHRYAMQLKDVGVSVNYNRLLLRLGRELELGGEIDLSNVKFLEHRLAERLAEGDAVADCSFLSFIDARGCRLLHEACNGQLGAGRLVLRHTPEVLARVMRVFDGVESQRS